MKASINVKDVIKKKINIDEIKYKYIIIYDYSKEANDLGLAINYFFKFGWVVQQMWAGEHNYVLLKHESDP